MGFVVLPALIPDIAAVYDVYFAAFANDPITRALFPKATIEDLTTSESEFRKAHTAHVLSYWHTSSTQYTLKCIDTSTGAVVGMGLWDVYPTPSDWKRGDVAWLEGQERERAEALVGPLWDAREKLWYKERYVYCHVIAVRPNYQRKGIGKLLTDFGMRIAEQAELPIYLESSKEGVALYEKSGFTRLKEKIVHKSEVLWAGDGQGNGKDCEVSLMVWVPESRAELLPKAVVLIQERCEGSLR